MSAVYYGRMEIADDKVFTKQRMREWRNHLLDSYEVVFEQLKSKIDHVSPIQFCLSRSLLDEVIVDAVIGMRKIVDSSNNSVNDPNPFKIAAYLGYWWLRHKPVSLHYPGNYRLEDVQIVSDGTLTAEENEDNRQRLAWQLKHINEIVAVVAVTTYIFDFDKEICDESLCEHIKRQDECFTFSNFSEMKDTILDKLLYYFSYRTIAPKVIEHLLEGYTFHPAWALTGALWQTNP